MGFILQSFYFCYEVGSKVQESRLKIVYPNEFSALFLRTSFLFCFVIVFIMGNFKHNGSRESKIMNPHLTYISIKQLTVYG